MRKIYKNFLIVFVLLMISSYLSAQNNFFTDAGVNTSLPTQGNRVIIPEKFRAASLDIQQMKSFLWSLPSEKNLVNRSQTPVLELPMPDGKLAKFHVWESSIQEPGLELKFPDIKTFAGQGIDDPYATIRFDYTPMGFHAQVLTINGTYYIDPYSRGDINNYISYYRSDFRKAGTFLCEVPDNPSTENLIPEAASRGTELSTYRLAVACTGEYAQAPGVNAGTNPAILHAAIVTTVNRVVGVYEKEIAVRLVLVANNNLVEFLDAATDPFNGNNNSNTLINESQTVIDANIGSANYDIGHTFSTGGGGLAQLNSPCTGSKARGITGSSQPTGDAYDIDYVAHEMGHQFGGNHSMAGCGSSPNSTKYEVGSGTTIQAYAGICGGENIQPNSDPYFHAISFDEISNFLSGGGSACGVVTPTGNNIPVLDPLPNNGVSIPINTPFTLTGTATDADNDALTYSWEQWDFSGTRSWNSGATASAGNTDPLFKSRIPKTTGSRTFPDIAVILAGYPASPSATMGGLKGETLSPVARAMKFKLTARDNKAGGGGVASIGAGGSQNSTVFQVNVVSTPSPFAVNLPNGGESYPGGSTQTITWNNAGTTAAPFNVANVKITLSTDGGFTYPTVITASTPNDGSEALTIPAITSSTARVKIEALGNIFFDISNANFSITAAPTGFSFTSPAPTVVSCPAPATMNVVLGTISNSGFSNPITLSTIAGVPGGTTITFGTNPVTPGSNSVVTLNNANTLNAGSYVVTIQGVAAGAANQTRDITFMITGGAGPAITTHPVNQTVCAGGSTTFSIIAAVATNFQWQFSTDGGSNYSNVTNGGVYGGATTATLSITGATAVMNAYRYRCIANTQCGSSTSNAGILTVNNAPAISTHPGSITLCAGSNHSFSIVATGAGLTYQWESSANGCAGPWIPISLATSASYSLTNITAGQNNTGYRCIVSGTCSPVATSNCALLTVVTSVTTTTQPMDATVCEGSNASFTVAGSGTGIIYLWQVSTNGGANYTALSNSGVYSGVTSATLSITGATFSMNNYRYRCQMTNATCATPGFSNGAILTVNTLPNITSHPISVTICLGSNTSFTAAGTGTGVGYQWQLSTDGGTVYNNISNGAVYSGATTVTLNITGATAAMNNYRYRCVITGTCSPAATTNAAILSVISPVSVSSQPAASVVCSGSNTSFAVSGTSTQTIVYQWQVSTNGGGLYSNISNGGIYSGATTTTLTITGTTTGLNTYLYRCQLSNANCTTPTNSNGALLTVRQLPSVTLTAAPITNLLPGQISTLTATPSASTGGIISTNWQFNGAASSPAITGNTYVANIEKVGTYQVFIQEVFSSPTLVCSNQSAVVTINAIESSKLFIFPSPNDGKFAVSYYNNGGASTKRKLAIYDSKGSSVYNAEFAISGPYTLLNINLERASRGLYFIVVGDATGKKLAEGKVHIR